MKKKVISLLLVVAMLLPMLSSAGFAQETELPAESTLIAGEAEEAVPAEKAETGEEAPVAEEPAAEEQVVPTEEAPAEEPAEKSDQEADAELADVAVLSQSVEIDGIALAPAPPEDGGNTGGGNTGGGNTGGGNIGGGNTGGGNNGGGNVSTSTSVDHIDIAVDMTALIQIGNETVEHDFTIGTNDAGKVSISAAYGDGTAVSFTKGSVTTSTDNAGNAQIRLDGTYPVGTKDNPVYYTVTYTDTIQVSYKGETYDVKVTLQVTTNYWDSSNVCPGLDNNTSSWQGGAIINGSGIDLALGTGSGTVGFAQIQKKIIGAVPTENQTFQFKVYKLVNGEYVQYKNVDVVVEAGTTNATVAIANVPFGSYKVEEITSGMAPVGGHKWVEVSYTNQTFTLSADKANQLVIAENIYKTVVPGKITISKQFVGLDTATALPAAIDFTVKNAAGETVAAVTLDEANKWTADVEGLYAGTYTVVEDTADAAVAGYTLAAVEPIQVTLTEGSMGADYQIPVSSAAASFTNSYSKKEKSEEVPASFSIKKVDSATGEVLPEAVFTLTDENGNVVGSAATNTAGIAEFAGLNVAGKYTLTETTPPAGYVESIQEWEVVISANDNTVLQDDWFVTTTTYTVAITGLDDGVLTVKNVKNTTDVHNPASFTIQKVDQDGEALAGAEFTLYDEKGTVVKTVTTDTDGKAFFGGFSEAAVYTLEETKAPDGYVGSSTVWTVTVTLKDGDPQLVLNEEKNIFENIYNWILGITPDSSWANGVLTVSNVKVGTLTVTKTVEYVVNGQKANELPVGSEYVEDSYRFTVTIGGKAETIELKAGDSKTFQDIPYGTEYTVVENGTGNEAWTGSISGGTGTIGKDNQDAEVKAVNTYTYREDVNPVSFSVKKVDSDDQKPLDGAVFRLTDAEGGVVAETAVVNGIAQFGPFQKEAEYALTEIQAPVGYQLSNQVWTVKIRSDSVTTLDQENKVIVTTVTYTAESEGMEDGTLTITNDKDIREIHNPAGFTIQKVDQDGAALAGAEFTLTNKADASDTITKTTGADGKVIFDGFQEAAEYTLEETKAPDDYIGSSTVWNVSVTLKDGAPALQFNTEDSVFENIYNWIVGIDPDFAFDAETNTLTVTNVKKTGSLTVSKTVEYWMDGKLYTGSPVNSGFEDGSYNFTVTIDGLEYSVDLMAGESHTFQDIPYGTAYTVVENRPDGAVWEGEIAEDNGEGVIGEGSDAVEVEVVNRYYYEDHTDGRIWLYKYDSETGEALAGAQFTLYADAQCTDALHSGITDEVGKLTLTLAQAGTYYLKETDAPEGYYESDKVYTITAELKYEVLAEAVIAAYLDIQVEGLAANQDGAYEIANDPVDEVNEVDVSVTKVWKNVGEDGHPDSVEVTLYRDGKAYDVQILSDKNDWTYTWTGLSGEYEWTVDETSDFDDYYKTIKQDGCDFTIINRHRSAPKTGDESLSWLWAVMAILSATGLGYCALKSKKQEN